jgi:hypothetical protein
LVHEVTGAPETREKFLDIWCGIQES